MSKEISFKVNNLNLWYKYGDKKALNQLNIEIPRREVTAFIGPSGCGKSTFLRCFNRMNDLIEGVVIGGSITFDDRFEVIQKNNDNKLKQLFKIIQKNNNIKFMDLFKKDKGISSLELRTRVGMVFQKPNPFPMSIYDNVAYGPKSTGIKSKKELDKIVKSALEDAALWKEVKDILQDPASGLSGGQQQRLCIARAIAMEPEVLLMDEPTSALDPIATAKIEVLIQKLKDKFTIIVVTHSMQQAVRVSDNTAFFYMGDLIEFNKTKEVFTSPKEKLTSDYLTGKMG